MTLQDTEPSDGAPEAEAAIGSKPVQVVEEAPFTVTAPVPPSRTTLTVPAYSGDPE